MNGMDKRPGRAADDKPMSPVCERFDRELLGVLVAEGWLRSMRHPDTDLWIYNYTEKTQYENHWTSETLVCRGLILDAEGGVVARPFAKFFNYGTPQVPTIPEEPFTVTEKIDGSLGILYELDGELFIASRGSFVSEQAEVGTAMLRERQIERTPGVTPLFEIVYPSNRIVVDYGARRDLILLGAIRHDDGRDAPLPRYSGTVVDRHADADDLAALAALAKPNAEGFVVSFESGLRVKIKFAEYVRLHKIVTGINARAIWEAMRDEQDVAALLDGIPDEVYAWIVTTAADIQGDFDRMEARAQHVFKHRPQTDDRKTLAAFFLASDANPAVLFRMLDGKPYADLIWKAIKPEALTPATAARVAA